MEPGTDSHYVSFLSERGYSDDDHRDHIQPSIRGAASESLREAVFAERNPECIQTRVRRFFSNTSRRLRRQRFLLWGKLWRNPRMKVRRAVAALLVVTVFVIFSVWMINSYISKEDSFSNIVNDNLEKTSVTEYSDGFPLKAHKWYEVHYQKAFNNFVNAFTRKYSSEEEKEYRYSIFKQNQSYINLHNDQGFSFTLKMNQFGDLTREEFRQRYLGKVKPKLPLLGVADELKSEALHKTLPETVDWLSKGCVTPVKDQQDCGSCWAFSTTGAVEGVVCAQGGKLPNLSEQQLVDCSGPEGNAGCHGGDMKQGFQYLLDANGLCSEQDYPYTATENSCKASSCTPVAQIKGFKSVPANCESALKAAIASNGPVSVSIQADQMPFQFYHDGVFDAACGDDLDHGVLAVGYGSDDKSKKDFWLVKNSWGVSWGSEGYIKMAMHAGDHGQCGILMDSSFPTMD